MRVLINGRYWTLRFVPASRLRKKDGCYDGDTDHPSVKRKTIRVAKGLEPADELETLIHEMLHASDGLLHHSEDWVSTVSKDIATVLLKLGWTKPDSE